ncbi:hypothetical protein [Polycladidibacter hongkongensis]|uniref:hypothetical protein n=1 Tax=Polycladidibacter hongkongensis TaxID=1647556 RepID=UPI000A7585BF|nr:hypothetical protein [Pseudovibrio hongkongensis]
MKLLEITVFTSLLIFLSACQSVPERSLPDTQGEQAVLHATASGKAAVTGEVTYEQKTCNPSRMQIANLVDLQRYTVSKDTLTVIPEGSYIAYFLECGDHYWSIKGELANIRDDMKSLLVFPTFSVKAGEIINIGQISFDLVEKGGLLSVEKHAPVAREPRPQTSVTLAKYYPALSGKIVVRKAKTALTPTLQERMINQ